MLTGSQERSTEPWVLIAGGFHEDGGMDQLNAGLARYLMSCDTPIDLVAYRISKELTRNSRSTVNLVRKPAGSFFLGQQRLDRHGRKIAAAVTARSPATRVLVNGINCSWTDINWVHFVHHAWPPQTDSGPRWLRLKNRIEAALALRRERQILRRSRLIIANSERTRRDLIERVGVPEELVVRIYPGCSKLAPVSRERRADVRRLLGIPDGLPVVIFVGALGYDSRKGFDTLWTVWRRLCARDDWKARLVVAGDGRALEDWRRKVRDAGLANCVLMLGFTDRIAELLAIADLMVSPVRYEPYGMSVHEAISFGIPAIVSAAAGIAELYPSALRDMLLVNPEDPDVLTKRLLDWNASQNRMKDRFEWFGKTLKARTIEQMACELVDTINTHPMSRNCAI